MPYAFCKPFLTPTLWLISGNYHGGRVGSPRCSFPLYIHRREGEGSTIVPADGYSKVRRRATPFMNSATVIDIDCIIIVNSPRYRTFTDESVLGMLRPYYAISGSSQVNLMLFSEHHLRGIVFVEHQVFVTNPNH